MSRYRYDPAANLGLAIGATLALLSAAKRPRPAPTPEQLARRAKQAERNDWNEAIDAKKAAKHARKAEPVGAERKAP